MSRSYKRNPVYKDGGGNRRKSEKKVMVLSVIHPYDAVEVLGVFDDIEKLRWECHKVIQRDTYLQQDISNLHIYECTLNHIFSEFYPIDYDKSDDEGCYLENQEDICGEILGEEFIQKLRMKQKEEKNECRWRESQNGKPRCI